MHTVVETSVYLREASKLLSDAERERVVSTIAKDPEIGDVIPERGVPQDSHCSSGRRKKRRFPRRLLLLRRNHARVSYADLREERKGEPQRRGEKPAEETVGGIQTQTQEVGDGEDVRRS